MKVLGWTLGVVFLIFVITMGIGLWATYQAEMSVDHHCMVDDSLKDLIPNTDVRSNWCDCLADEIVWNDVNTHEALGALGAGNISVDYYLENYIGQTKLERMMIKCANQIGAAGY